MKNNITKNIFSSSAKKIKKEIEIQSKNSSLSYQRLIILLEEESKESHNSPAYKPNYSLLRLNNIQSKIKNKIYKESGVYVSSVDFIKREIDQRRKIFRSANDSYTLAQYMQNYNILTNRDVFKKDITTYKEAIENADVFSKELIMKYKDLDQYLIKKYRSGNCNSDQVRDLEELYIILKKRESNVHLSNCDEVLEDIIKNIIETKEYNPDFFKELSNYCVNKYSEKIKQELIRVKILTETRLEYSVLVENIDPYHFHIRTDAEKKLVQDLILSNNEIFNSEIGVCLGKNENINSKLTSELENKDFLGKNVVMLKQKNVNGLIKLKKAITKSFIPSSYVGLTNKELEEGVYITATIGSGFSETLKNYFVQNFVNNEVNIMFGIYGDNRTVFDMQVAQRISQGRSNITVITHIQLLSLTKEKILSLLKKEKSIVFSLKTMEILDLETLNKYITKIRFIIDIIGKHKKDKYHNIFIDDANMLFNEKNTFGKSFADDFHTMKKTFNKTKFFIKGRGSVDRDFFKEFKYKILMKTECNLSFDIFDTTDFKQSKTNIEGYDSQKIFNSNIMGLTPGEFILVKDNKVSLENIIYKFRYLNFYNLESDSYCINFDLND